MTLKEFRKEKNLSIQDMAKRIGISKSYYEKIEYGNRSPSYNFIKKIKRQFPELDINEFIN